MFAVTEVREALLALRRIGYTSTFLLTHRAGSSFPPTHTRLDSSQLFQASATVRHCLTIFEVKIQLDH